MKYVLILTALIFNQSTFALSMCEYGKNGFSATNSNGYVVGLNGIWQLIGESTVRTSPDRHFSKTIVLADKSIFKATYEKEILETSVTFLGSGWDRYSYPGLSSFSIQMDDVPVDINMKLDDGTVAYRGRCDAGNFILEKIKSFTVPYELSGTASFSLVEQGSFLLLKVEYKNFNEINGTAYYSNPYLLF